VLHLLFTFLTVAG